MAESKGTSRQVKVGEFSRRMNTRRTKLADYEVGLALALRAEGVSKRAIARKLYVSPHTVDRVLER